MAKATLRRGKLTVALPDEIRDRFAVRDGDEFDVTSEDGRLVLTPAAETASSEESKALDEAEAEFAQGKTRRLDDLLLGLGRKAR